MEVVLCAPSNPKIRRCDCRNEMTYVQLIGEEQVEVPNQKRVTVISVLKNVERLLVLVQSMAESECPYFPPGST